MRRWAPALVLLAGCAGPPLVADGMPEDLKEVVLATMESIESALPARADCLRGVTVTHARDLDDRAEYRPASRTIVLRVPATAADLEFSLAHEIAHHLEVTCAAQTDLRPPFLAALGGRPGQPWFEGDSWETTPSEQFATAIAQLVTGGTDPRRRVDVPSEAMHLVEGWATGPR